MMLANKYRQSRLHSLYLNDNIEVCLFVGIINNIHISSQYVIMHSF